MGEAAMTTDRIIGALQADMENVKDDVAYIRAHMVTRQEFERTAAEHSGFRRDIAALQKTDDRSEILIKWVERGVWALVVLGAATLFGG